MLHFFDIELEMITSRRITALAVGLVTAAFSPVRGTVSMSQSVALVFYAMIHLL